MADTEWPELGGKTVRYHDDTWELTGNVDAREAGRLLAVEARQADDVRHPTATLHFGIEDGADSLNPGNLGDHFDRLERRDGRQYLLVKKDRQTYRYELRRLEYQ
jgi:hypothetical protein